MASLVTDVGISRRDLIRRAHLDIRVLHDIIEQMRSRLRTHVLEADARRDAWLNEVQLAALYHALKALQNASALQDIADQQMPEPHVRRVTEVQLDAPYSGVASSRDARVAALVSASGVGSSTDVALSTTCRCRPEKRLCMISAIGAR